jgi:hypothetical protein
MFSEFSVSGFHHAGRTLWTFRLAYSFPSQPLNMQHCPTVLRTAASCWPLTLLQHYTAKRKKQQMGDPEIGHLANTDFAQMADARGPAVRYNR